jgi:hypothetical protein
VRTLGSLAFAPPQPGVWAAFLRSLFTYCVLRCEFSMMTYGTLGCTLGVLRGAPDGFLLLCTLRQCLRESLYSHTTIAVVSAACAGSRQYLVSSLSITPGGRRQPKDVFNTQMKSSGTSVLLCQPCRYSSNLAGVGANNAESHSRCTISSLSCFHNLQLY